MTLEEMFSEKPELLNEPLVQKLIEYVKDRHSTMNKFIQTAEKKYDNVIDLCMYSEVMLIDGRPSKDVVKDILEQYGNN